MPVRYDKLVRDRIPEIIQAQGQHPVTRILDNASYQEALLPSSPRRPAKHRKPPPPRISLANSPTSWR
jgi:hypothetical protein